MKFIKIYLSQEHSEPKQNKVATNYIRIHEKQCKILYRVMERCCRSSLVAQWVEDLMSLQQLWFDPWPKNLCMLWTQPKEKKKKSKDVTMKMKRNIKVSRQKRIFLKSWKEIKMNFRVSFYSQLNSRNKVFMKQEKENMSINKRNMIVRKEK